MTFYGTDIDNSHTGGNSDYYGGQGNDWIYGDGANDDLYGGEGSDVLAPNAPTAFTGSGGAGSPYANQDGINSGTNYVYGETGSDCLMGYDGADILYGGQDSDSGTISVANGAVFYIAGLYGGAGDDYLDGGQGSDDLYGGGDTDTLIGGFGNDNLYGGGGFDYIYCDHDADNAYGGAGDDFIWGGYYRLSTETLFVEGNNGADTIIAGTFNDVLYGDNVANTESGSDFIWGAAGNDTIYGGQSVDQCVGYYGSDTLYGGAGGDAFNFYYDVNGNDLDVIFDFQFGLDYLLLPYWNQNDVIFFESGGYAWAFIDGAPTIGDYYIAAFGITAAQFSASTFYI